MSENKKLKVAQVGVYGFGQYRRKTLHDSDLFEIVGGFDYNEKSIQKFEEQEKVSASGSFDDLLNIPDLDVLVVSTGASSHAEYTIKAMEKGLHVFVEKPLCSTADEMKAILHKQKETGMIVGMGHNDHSADKFSLHFKKMIDSGELGNILTFEKTTGHNGGMKITPGAWRGEKDNNPGGMLFQCGVHSLHELMYYFGPVKSVYCHMRYDVHTTETADMAQCLLEFESGVKGNLNAYHVAPYRHTFSVFGTKTNVYREDLYGPVGTKVYQQTSHFDGKYEPKEEIEFEWDKDPCGGLRSFYDAITQGGNPYPSALDGARALAVIFAAAESEQTGCKVSVDKYMD